MGITNLRRETLEIIEGYYQMLIATDDEELKQEFQKTIIFLLEGSRTERYLIIDHQEI